MPNVIKVVEHDPLSDKLLYHRTSSDIVDFDNSNSNIESNDAENAIKEVNNKADSKADTTTYNAKIIATAFEGVTAPYSQKIEIEGILSTDNPIVGITNLSDIVNVALEQRDSWGSINRITCGDGFIVAYCYEDLPSVDIDIQLKVIR